MARRRELEVVALTDHEWRVCDGRLDEGDGRRIIGYIAEDCGHFEVLALKPSPVVCGTYDCLDESLEALVRETSGPGGGLRTVA